MWAIYATPFRPPTGYRGRGCCVTPARLSVQAVIVLSGTLSLHDLVDGPVRLSLAKTAGINDAGRAWSIHRPTFWW